MPRSIISFGLEDDFKDGFKEGTTFKGLSDIISWTEDFFLKAGIKAGTEVKTGTEVEIGTVTGVFGTVEITGILKIAGIIIGAVEIKAANGAGSSYARHGKTVS